MKKAVAEAMQENMKNFYIDRELHYKHHEYLEDWIDWTKDWKSCCRKAFAGMLVVGVITCLVIGFVVKIGGHVGK